MEEKIAQIKQTRNTRNIAVIKIGQGQLKKESHIGYIKIDQPNKNEYKAKNVYKFNLLKKFIYLMIFFKVISDLNAECNIRKLQIENPYIILTTIGEGDISILNSNFSPLPDEIYLNEEKEENISFKYHLINPNGNFHNYFILVWNESLNDTSYMFKDCNNITEILFSYFDTTQVTNMEYMFYGCTNLEYLDLYNFDTS